MLTQALMRKPSVVRPTLSLRTSEVAGNLKSSITIPATAQVGDLAFLFNYGGGTPHVPTGWTQLSQLKVGTWGGIVSYKILESGDPGSTITGTTYYFFGELRLFVFAPSAPINSVVFQSFSDAIANAKATTQVVSAQSPSYVVIGAIGNYSGDVWESVWYDSTISTGFSRSQFAYKLFNSSPASVSVGMGGSSFTSAYLCSFAAEVYG